jgi:lysozyme
MNLNGSGIALIKRFESCSLTVYRDIRGLATVGYGHRTLLDIGHTISQDEADQLLVDDCQRTVDALKACIKIQLSDNEFSACVSLAFNIGVNAFKNSTLLKLLNGGGLVPAANAFLDWDHANGVVIPGLTRRRQAEKDLFLKG